MRALHSPSLKEFHIRNCLPSGNKVGYFSCISLSDSQVASAILWCFQSTLTQGILLFLSYFSILSNIRIGSSTYVRFTLIRKGSSKMYFRRLDTWNTSCMPCTEGGRANQYATRPIVSRISKGPTNLGLSFPFWPNLMLPLSEETFRNIWSPTLNYKCLLLISA